MAMDIIKPGFMTTIQDAGRQHFQQYGVIVAGAMDQMSYRMANMLLQQDDLATLEITMIGPTIQFSQPTIIALTGADFQPVLNGVKCPMWRPVVIRAGDVLVMRTAKTGARGYLAVQGGIDVVKTLGSRSTYLRAKMGGYQGRMLQSGDVLPYTAIDQASKNERWFVDPSPFVRFQQQAKIRIVEGTEWHQFSKQSQHALLTTPFTVSSQSDRMGYRLQSNTLLEQSHQQELLSEAVTYGTLQVPPNGQPILLMADRQTTGGYPKIAQVVAVDLPNLAQLLPGATIQFEMITLQQAQQLYVEREQLLRGIKWGIQICAS